MTFQNLNMSSQVAFQSAVGRCIDPDEDRVALVLGGLYAGDWLRSVEVYTTYNSGDLNRTKSGRECQAWNLQTPHDHEYSSVGNHSYCRNPSNNEGGPWCYTTDPDTRWEFCSVRESGNERGEKKNGLNDKY